MSEPAPRPIDQLNKKKELRLRATQFLYEFSNGDEMKWVSGEEISLALRADSDVVGNALDYLEGEGLVKIQAMGGGGLWGITHAGVVEVEQSIARPDQPTEHFPPNSGVVHIHGNVIHSAIQTGTSNSQITLSVPDSQETIQLVERFISEVRSNLDVLAADEEQRRRIEADLSSVEMQLKLENPNRGVMREAITSVRSVVESATGSGLVLGLVELSSRLPF